MRRRFNEPEFKLKRGKQLQKFIVFQCKLS
jgi:hypothetical protein